MKKWICLKRLNRDIKKMRKRAWSDSIIYSVLNGIHPYLYLILSVYILDAFSRNADANNKLFVVIAIILLNALVILVEGCFSNYCSDHADACSMLEKNQLTEKLINVSYEVFTDSEFLKNVDEIRSETNTRDGLYSDYYYTVQCIVSSVTGILSALIAFIKIRDLITGDAIMVCIVFLVVVIAAIIFTLLKTYTYKRERSVRDEYNEIDGIYEEYRDKVAHYKTGKEIRIFKMQKLIKTEATGKLLKEGYSLQKSILKYDSIAEILGFLVFACITLGIYYTIGYKALSGIISVGEMVLIIGAASNLVDSIKDFSGNIGELEDYNERAQMYYEVIDAIPPKELKTDNNECNFNTICFDKVTYSYPDADKKAINNVSFTIEKGERIAVVGENGSGKTTLIKLLCGLIKPKSGSIKIDGIDYTEFGEKEYQENFAVVFQDFNIFSLPIGENVAVSADYNEEEVRDAINKVGFPSKYALNAYAYKDCDADGIELSGGEVQKLALARALIKEKAKILILDEPTSAMDPFAEMNLYRNFNDYVAGKSAIYISHRLSSCRFCDRILVIDKGKLVQQGTHEELLCDTCGKYYELWNTQAKYWSVEEAV